MYVKEKNPPPVLTYHDVMICDVTHVQIARHHSWNVFNHFLLMGWFYSRLYIGCNYKKRACKQSKILNIYVEFLLRLFVEKCITVI